jgi:hypothetical protein
MWIWELPASSGGNLATIIAQAKRYGVRTLFIKSSDGVQPWAQFTRAMVSAFTAAGLHVCAWQYVYGQHPADEARLGAGAVKEGASCLVIDAESQYQGRYAAAQRYLSLLRAQVGKKLPVGLAGLPYVSYHPSFPYSVFLGPGGAQYNLPQMYWKDIGTSVREVFAHTYLYNRLWGRPIFPIGQTYGAPGLGPLRLFRRYSASYGTVPSWWDWQETTTPEWGAVGSRAGRRKLPGFDPEVEYPLLRLGAKGDLVVWAQERLITAGEELEVNGIFEGKTRRAVRAFQEAHGLEGDGQLGSETWAQLVNYTPFRVEWAAATPIVSSTAARSLAHRPRSASLPAIRDELTPPDCGPQR